MTVNCGYILYYHILPSEMIFNWVVHSLLYDKPLHRNPDHSQNLRIVPWSEAHVW